jgi:tetratricopeptide (TPR) repeat protein
MEAKKSFEESFPESTLSPKEKALLEYLRGRSEYHKGEYIGALELLDKAYRAADKKDEEFISDILNTAASSFTDNLFFEHARILLREALAIREKLSLGTKAETISAIGVLAFKNGNFDEAYSLFTQALREMRTSNFVKDENRILNYLAKAALYKGDSATSDTFLDEALGKADRVEQKLFSHAIRMASLVMRKEFQSAHELFQETFLLPEHHQHCFPVAWGYFFEAEASFQLGRLKDAIRHQARCVDLFLSDRFILEAGLASIKPFLWNPDIEHLELFYENINEENIVNELIEYRDNHEDLPERFFTEFFDKNDSATHPETSSLRGLADLPQRFLSNLFSGGIFNRESKGAMLSKTIDMIISATQAKSAQKARKTLEHAYFL